MHNLTFEHAQSIVQAAVPGHQLVSIKSAFGSFTNDVRILECRTPEGHARRLVVKFVVDQSEYSTRNAVAHFHALQLARVHGIPVPEPVFLDETGKVLGAPGLVTGFIEGKQIADPEYYFGWAKAQGQMLLRIHAIRPQDEYQPKLFDGNLQTLYFLEDDWPERLAEHPLTADIMNAVESLQSSLVSVPPVLVHLDYWHGNVLWQDDQISAIVDWDFAGYGDPAIDVAYFRMNMYLRGIKAAADIFLDAYEAGAGSKIKNLGFRELAAAPQPLPDPLAWLPMNSAMGGKKLTDDEVRANYQEFVRGALGRAYAGR